MIPGVGESAVGRSWVGTRANTARPGLSSELAKTLELLLDHALQEAIGASHGTDRGFAKSSDGVLE